MAAINFPSNPQIGDIYQTDFGYAFQYDGTVWKNYFAPGVYGGNFELESDSSPVLGNHLDAGGLNISNAGIVTATRYYGDGSYLTGVAASGGSVAVSNKSSPTGSNTNITAEASAIRFLTADFDIDNLSGGEVLISSKSSGGGFTSIYGISASTYPTLNLTGNGIALSKSGSTITFSASLNTLSDTDNIGTAVNGQVLKYSGVLSKWIPQADATGGSTGGGEVGPDDFVYAAGFAYSPGYWSPTSSGAVSLSGSADLKNWLDALNNTLGLLAPSAPPTIAGKSINVTLTSNNQYNLCGQFTPTNNASTVGFAPSPGTSYKWAQSGSVSSNQFTNVGNAASGTLFAYVNETLIGQKALTDQIDDGNYTGQEVSGTTGLQIDNDRDASEYYNDATNPSRSVNGKAIPPGFFSIMDVKIHVFPISSCPEGFNYLDMKQTIDGVDNEVANKGSTPNIFYKDTNPTGAPTVSVGTVTLPTGFVGAFSSGVEHLPAGATFSYNIDVANLTGDFYKSGNPINIASSTALNSASVDWATVSGFNVPPQNFAATPVTVPISQVIKTGVFDVIASNHFGAISITTPYGSTNSSRATISDTLLVNSGVVGNVPSESQISMSSGTGSNSARVSAGSGVDTPAPASTGATWVSSDLLPPYEASIVGGTLGHDTNNYASGFYPATAADYSGNNAEQYAQFVFTAASIQTFQIQITGSYSGLWVCMPNNSTSWLTGPTPGWTGWADCFTAYSGGRPGDGTLGGASVGSAATGSSGTVGVNFGSSSTAQSTGAQLVFVRFKFTAGQSITSLKFA